MIVVNIKQSDDFNYNFNKINLFLNSEKLVNDLNIIYVNKYNNVLFIRKFISFIIKKGLLKRYKNFFYKLRYFNFFNFKDIFNFLSNNLFFFYFKFNLINKNIRKFSRGKSGKYKLVFNFIPFFKRFNVTLRLFMKELSFLNFRNFKLKLKYIINSINLEKKGSFLLKLKKYTYNKIYNNYKEILI